MESDFINSVRAELWNASSITTTVTGEDSTEKRNIYTSVHTEAPLHTRAPFAK